MDAKLRDRRTLLRPTVLILFDLALLEASFLVTYWFRFQAGVWKTPLGVPPFDLYLASSVVALVVFPAIWRDVGTMAGASLLVQMGLATQGGVFWGVLMAGAEKQARR